MTLQVAPYLLNFYGTLPPLHLAVAYGKPAALHAILEVNR